MAAVATINRVTTVTPYVGTDDTLNAKVSLLYLLWATCVEAVSQAEVACEPLV